MQQGITAVPEHILGIDLGTTFSSVGVWNPEENDVTLLRGHHRRALFPSVIWVPRNVTDHSVLVGHAAARQGVLDPAGLVFGAKRLIGVPFKEGIKERLLPAALFEVVQDVNGGCLIIVRGHRKFTPEMVSATILQHLRGVAEYELKVEVSKAFVTVPAHFTEVQKEATLNAAWSAGLKVGRLSSSLTGLLNEPVAVSLTHFNSVIKPAGGAAVAPVLESGSNMLVFDLGGGTLDLTLMEVDPGDSFVGLKTRRILGDQCLGGQDFDACLLDLVRNKIADLTVQKQDVAKALIVERTVGLLSNCIEAKEILSHRQETRIDISSCGFDIEEITVTRQEFQHETRHLVRRSLQLVDEILDMGSALDDELDIKMDAKDISLVLLAGGSALLPHIKVALKKRFSALPGGQANQKQVPSVQTVYQPHFAVCRGAAIKGAHANEHYALDGISVPISLTNVTPFDLKLVCRRRDDSDDHHYKARCFEYAPFPGLHYAETIVPRFTLLPFEGEVFRTILDENQGTSTAVCLLESPFRDIWDPNECIKLGSFGIGHSLSSVEQPLGLSVWCSLDEAGMIECAASIFDPVTNAELNMVKEEFVYGPQQWNSLASAQQPTEVIQPPPVSGAAASNATVGDSLKEARPVSAAAALNGAGGVGLTEAQAVSAAAASTATGGVGSTEAQATLSATSASSAHHELDLRREQASVSSTSRIREGMPSVSQSVQPPDDVVVQCAGNNVQPPDDVEVECAGNNMTIKWSTQNYEVLKGFAVCLEVVQEGTEALPQRPFKHAKEIVHPSLTMEECLPLAKAGMENDRLIAVSVALFADPAPPGGRALDVCMWSDPFVFDKSNAVGEKSWLQSIMRSTMFGMHQTGAAVKKKAKQVLEWVETHSALTLKVFKSPYGRNKDFWVARAGMEQTLQKIKNGDSELKRLSGKFSGAPTAENVGSR